MKREFEWMVFQIETTKITGKIGIAKRLVRGKLYSIEYAYGQKPILKIDGQESEWNKSGLALYKDSFALAKGEC